MIVNTGRCTVAASLSLSLSDEVESCLQNIPDFKDYSDGTHLLARTEAIVPAYTFNCSGVLTEWGAYVKPGDPVQTYYIQFQVWRPSLANGCYVSVGHNLLSEGRPDINGQIVLLVQDENQFTVQPGDVVGLHVGGSGGVQMTTDADSTVVWHTEEELRFTDPGMCKLSAGEGRELGISQAAAPVVTAVVLRTGKPYKYPLKIT